MSKKNLEISPWRAREILETVKKHGGYIVDGRIVGEEPKEEFKWFVEEVPEVKVFGSIYDVMETILKDYGVLRYDYSVSYPHMWDAGFNVYVYRVHVAPSSEYNKNDIYFVIKAEYYGPDNYYVTYYVYREDELPYVKEKVIDLLEDVKSNLEDAEPLITDEKVYGELKEVIHNIEEEIKRIKSEYAFKLFY